MEKLQQRRISAYLLYTVYYTQLNREAGLLHTAEQGGGAIYKELNKEAGLLYVAEKGGRFNLF